MSSSVARMPDEEFQVDVYRAWPNPVVCVRVTHLPTGTVRSDESPSQHDSTVLARGRCEEEVLRGFLGDVA